MEVVRATLTDNRYLPTRSSPIRCIWVVHPHSEFLHRLYSQRDDRNVSAKTPHYIVGNVNSV